MDWQILKVFTLKFVIGQEFTNLYLPIQLTLHAASTRENYVKIGLLPFSRYYHPAVKLGWLPTAKYNDHHYYYINVMRS